MLLRRISGHLKTQNWLAMALDLIIVVVGIFLAFQADRWYEGKRTEAALLESLIALSEDFRENREEIERGMGAQANAESAARKLLALDDMHSDAIDHDQFYSLLAASSRSGTPSPRRRAYDVLISTGQMELLKNNVLRIQLAAFYADMEELKEFGAGAWQYDRNTFEPYVIRELDHVAMLKRLHVSSTEDMRLSRPPDQYISVIGTAEFEGVLSGKWHVSSDLLGRFEIIYDRLVAIESLLEDEIRAMTKSQPVTQKSG